MSGNKLIINPQAKFGGKTLSEIAKKPFKEEKKQGRAFPQKKVQSESISVLDHYKQGKTQKEAVEAANSQDMALVSNKWADDDLNKHDGYNQRKEATGSGNGAKEEKVYAIWTGTLIAYRKPGEKLGSEIAYTDSQTSETYIFRVPVQFQNEVDCALVVQHSILENGASNIIYHPIQNGAGIAYEIKITDESSIQLIRDFPAKNGWYLPENSCGIPVGSGVESDNDAARYFWRVTDASYIGLVARGSDYVDGLRNVYAVDLPSYRLGVLAQKTE